MTPLSGADPLIGNTIKQFGEEVLWGKLDYLIIDLPPGTADAPLTVMQSFPISGVIIVFTPQDLVEMIVKKAVNMVRKMDKRVLGVVENMSYLYVPEIDKRLRSSAGAGERRWPVPLMHHSRSVAYRAGTGQALRRGQYRTL